MRYTLADPKHGLSHRDYVEIILSGVARHHIRINLEVDPVECLEWYQLELGWHI